MPRFFFFSFIQTSELFLFDFPDGLFSEPSIVAGVYSMTGVGWGPTADAGLWGSGKRGLASQ